MDWGPCATELKPSKELQQQTQEMRYWQIGIKKNTHTHTNKVLVKYFNARRGAEPSKDQLVGLVVSDESRVVVLREAGEKQIRCLLRPSEKEQLPFGGIPLGQAARPFMMERSKNNLPL